MSFKPLDPAVVMAVKAAGFRVFMNPDKHWQSYLFFSDEAERIGYLQKDHFGGYKLSTVHIPCKECGTGFGLDGGTNLTRDDLARAFIQAPTWASQTDRNAVRKYPSLKAFLNSHKFTKLEEV